MIAVDFFAAAERLPFATIEEITQGNGLLVVAPHPDDESLGCGGLIAEACAVGLPVSLVVVSDGVGSHPNSKTHPAPILQALREAETISAVAELGMHASAVRFLRLPDRSVPTIGPLADRACREIVAAARQISAGAICATWGRDPHCDHVATARLVEECRAHLDGTRVFFYPVWGWTLPDDMDVGSAPSGVRFDADLHMITKMTAVAAHRSQTTDLIADDPHGFRLAPTMIEILARRYELLLDASGLTQP